MNFTFWYNYETNEILEASFITNNYKCDVMFDSKAVAIYHLKETKDYRSLIIRLNNFTYDFDFSSVVKLEEQIKTILTFI